MRLVGRKRVRRVLEIGTVLEERYRIVEVIGYGGTSTVYRAMNERVNKVWAIKEIPFHDRMQIYSFLNEVSILRKLHHPSFPDIVDIIQKENALFLVMSYVEGKTLKEILEQSGPQEEAIVLQWAKELCDILFVLHNQTPPIIYRDMKPSNIKVTAQGRVMLIDFGTAREWNDNKIDDTVCLGTRGYAAPEQYEGEGQTDERTDLYCLGVTLYYLLTGCNPAKPPYQLYPIRYWKKELSASLEAVILKCTRQNPEERYQSCQELRQALEACEKHSFFKWKKRRKLFIKVLTGIFSLLLFCFCVNIYNQREARAYNRYLVLGQNSFAESEKCFYYKRAIARESKRGEAYEALIEVLTLDGNLGISDMKILMDSIYQKKGEHECFYYYEHYRRNEKQKESYRRFCYSLGIACFFQSEGVNGKLIASGWFEKYLDTFEKKEKEAWEQRQRAKLYQKIGNYYEKNFHQEEKVELEEVRIFFNDLKALNKIPLGEEGENKIFLLYNEIVVQIMNKATLFLQAGITKDTLCIELDRMDEKIKFLKNQITKEQWKQLEENIRCAKESVENIVEER